ncbi:MFS transporter [Bacillus sp. AK128]
MSSANRLIAALLVVTGVFVASNIYTLIPIYDVLSQDLNTTTSVIALGSTSFTLCYAVGLLIFGSLSDAIGRKPILIIGMLIFALTSLLVAFADSKTMIILTRGLQGFAGGSFAPIAFAYTFDLYKGKYLALILSLINTGFLVAGILGQLISASITAHYSWEHVFYFFSIIYLSVFILSLKLLPQQTAEVKPSFHPIKSIKLFARLLKSRNLLLCYLITFSLLLTPLSFYDTLNQYLSPYHTADELFTLRAIALLGTVLSLFGGFINDRFGLKGSFYIGIFVLISGLIPMLVAPSYFVIMCSAVLLVAATSILIPTIIAIIGTIEQRARGSAIALYSFTLLVGASFGSVLTSLLSFQGVLLFLLFYGLINIWMIKKISYSI